MDKKAKAVELLHEYELKHGCIQEESWEKLVVEMLKLFDD